MYRTPSYNRRFIQRRENFNVPTAQQVLGWADLQTMGNEMLTQYKQVECDDVDPVCNAFIDPVFNAADRTCNNAYASIAGICTELGQSAYDWGTRQSLFPSGLKAPLRDLVVRQCNSIMPSASVMCGWTDTLRDPIRSRCQSGLNGAFSC